MTGCGPEDRVQRTNPPQTWRGTWRSGCPYHRSRCRVLLPHHCCCRPAATCSTYLGKWQSPAWSRAAVSGVASGWQRGEKRRDGSEVEGMSERMETTTTRLRRRKGREWKDQQRRRQREQERVQRFLPCRRAASWKRAGRERRECVEWSCVPLRLFPLTRRTPPPRTGPQLVPFLPTPSSRLSHCYFHLPYDLYTPAGFFPPTACPPFSRSRSLSLHKYQCACVGKDQRPGKQATKNAAFLSALQTCLQRGSFIR